MKRLIIIFSLLFVSFFSFAQGGPIKFLGIPVDGSESQFVSKLKSKGFRYDSLSESYKGQFNGQNVDVLIHTNHNLVDRVMVAFSRKSEQDIIHEFNNLLSQFQESDKYLDLSINEEIPEDEDISYEISVHNKRYQATFSYFNPDRDPIEFMNAMLEKLSDFFTDEQLTKLREYSQNVTVSSADELDGVLAQLMEEMEKLGVNQNLNIDEDPEKAWEFFVTILDKMASLADGDVWFMINELSGRYYIALFYDNLKNRPHGEDL